jgi:transposase
MATRRLENIALRAENAALRERIRDLDALLGQQSANSSRPPSADPPQAPVRPKAPPSGRKRGGQPGHRGAYRALLPVEQVDELVAVVPERSDGVRNRFPKPPAAAVAGHGGIKWWSCCRWRCG